MTCPEIHRIKGRGSQCRKASVTQPVPVGGGEKADRRVCLALEAEVTYPSAPGAPVWRVVVVIQKVAGRAR